MTTLNPRLRGVLVALIALAFSTGVAFAAKPASTGLPNAATHAGKTVPVAADDEDSGDQDTEESTDTESEDNAGDNCTTDPTALSADELAAMRHGSIVCWAAHQTSWPEWFSNKGAFVKCWAHQGKPDAPSCTEDPAAQQPAAAGGASSTHGNGKGKGQGHSQ